MDELNKLYSSRLKIIFNSSDKEKDKLIESISHHITEVLLSQYFILILLLDV